MSDEKLTAQPVAWQAQSREGHWTSCSQEHYEFLRGLPEWSATVRALGVIAHPAPDTQSVEPWPQSTSAAIQHWDSTPYVKAPAPASEDVLPTMLSRDVIEELHEIGSVRLTSAQLNTLCREVVDRQSRAQPSTASDEYRRANPLAGPAATFDGIADLIRAGDPVERAMRVFGVQWVQDRSA